jgi:hypothetical protein
LLSVPHPIVGTSEASVIPQAYEVVGEGVPR